MSSANITQFRIWHIMAAVVLVSVGMALIATKQGLAVLLGVLLVVGVAGSFCGYFMMLISDLIDDRRIDDRKLSSRFFNGIGLLIIVATAASVAILGAMLVLQSGIQLLDLIP